MVVIPRGTLLTLPSPPTAEERETAGLPPSTLLTLPSSGRGGEGNGRPPAKNSPHPALSSGCGGEGNSRPPAKQRPGWAVPASPEIFFGVNGPFDYAFCTLHSNLAPCVLYTL